MEEKLQPVKVQDLNKTQLILLAILLSFVISIATGIVTATLLQQAPPAVTQTINRVVQHTIEKVVPDYVPTKNQTIIVKEEDLVVDTVSKTRDSLFPVFPVDTGDMITNAYSVGNGTFVAQDDLFDLTKNYIIKNGENKISVKVSRVSPSGIAVLIADPVTKGLSDLPKGNFGKDADIKAGETALIVSPTGISKDMVQNIIAKEEKDKDGKVSNKWSVLSLGQTPRAVFGGAPVADLDGNIIGFVISNIGADGSALTQVVGIDLIRTMLGDGVKDTSKTATSTAN